MNLKALAGLVCVAGVSLASTALARSVYLNGIDVSSARNQTLKNVQIKINENGDVFILAPHYQVNEEETYTPLSRFVQGATGPTHETPKTDVEQKVGIKSASNVTGTSPETVNVTDPAAAAPVIGETAPSQNGSAEKAGTKTTP